MCVNTLPMCVDLIIYRERKREIDHPHADDAERDHPHSKREHIPTIDAEALARENRF